MLAPRRLARRLLPLTLTLAVTTGLTQAVSALPAPGRTTLAAPAATVVTPPVAPAESTLHPRPTPAPAPRVVAPVATRHRAVAPRPHPRPVRLVRRVRATTFEQELRRQVSRIPLYQSGLARWVVYPHLANYAITDRVHRIVYVSPDVPRRLLYSVVVHEWGHVISTVGYADLQSADAAVLRWYGGGSSSVAIERAADCIARVLGATWTHYTACTDSHWHYGARYLAAGWKLPDTTTA